MNKNHNQLMDKRRSSKIKWLLLVLLCSIYMHRAQDTLLFENGTKISALIAEINDSEIVYSEFENLNSPIHTCPINEIAAIKFKNGIREVPALNEKRLKSENRDTAYRRKRARRSTVSMMKEVFYMLFRTFH